MQSRLDANAATVDASLRGIPFATPTPVTDLLSAGLRPDRGDLALPALTLDEAAFRHNRDVFFRYLAQWGAAAAPHAKTPMSPELVAELREAGAWGASVANIQQLTVLLQAGERRLLLANEIGGRQAGKRLGHVLAAFPDVRLYAFADSVDAVTALAEAADIGGLTELSVLVEVGAGRAGARDAAAVSAVLGAIGQAGPRLRLAGVAAYEGAVASADPVATQQAIAALMERMQEVFAQIRRLKPQDELVVTAGGSAYFDVVLAALAPMCAEDQKATLLLRSGALFFGDHGIYARAFAGIDQRNLFQIAGEQVSAVETFRPTLRLWAEILSRPEPGLAIAGFGMRDVSFDQDLPVLLSIHRDGLELEAAARGIVVEKLNDQHAFLRLPAGSDVRVGDILCLGISHPCTCLDRWRAVLGLDESGTVSRVLRTHFG